MTGPRRAGAPVPFLVVAVIHGHGKTADDAVRDLIATMTRLGLAWTHPDADVRVTYNQSTSEMTLPSYVASAMGQRRGAVQP